MDAISQERIDLGENREITFTNLDPGSYQFSIRASNSDGIWSDPAGPVLSLTVLRPYWQAWWFRLAVLAGLGLVAYAVHRYRSSRLAQRLAERAQAAQALR